MATKDTDQGEEDEDRDVFEREVDEVSTLRSEPLVSLRSADLFDLEEADRFLRRYPAELVAVVGERDSGKTTLICALYDRFRRGPFESLAFVGSHTLLGFERKCYASREASGLAKPDTPRTSTTDGLQFFHLCLIDEDGAFAPTNLLISERAGESYRAARDIPAKARDLVELAKAKRIVFVVDGERVCNPLTRAEAFGAVRSSLRAYADSGAIGQQSHIQVVTTKTDCLRAGRDDDALVSLDDFEANCEKLFGARFASLTFFRVAARDPTGEIELAHGVPTLVRTWVMPDPTPDHVLTRPPLLSEFDKLLARPLFEDS